MAGGYFLDLPGDFDGVVEDHLMPRAFNHMEVDVLKISSQSLCALAGHPVAVPIEEVYLDLGPHLANDLLDASYRLQGPSKQRVKPSLATFIDLADMLHVSLPR